MCKANVRIGPSANYGDNSDVRPPTPHMGSEEHVGIYMSKVDRGKNPWSSHFELSLEEALQKNDELLKSRAAAKPKG